MKRAVEAREDRHARQDVALARRCRPSRSSPIQGADLRAEQLKGKADRGEPLHGSHFTTLKLLEGFLKREQISGFRRDDEEAWTRLAKAKSPRQA